MYHVATGGGPPVPLFTAGARANWKSGRKNSAPPLYNCCLPDTRWLDSLLCLVPLYLFPYYASSPISLFFSISCAFMMTLTLNPKLSPFFYMYKSIYACIGRWLWGVYFPPVWSLESVDKNAEEDGSRIGGNLFFFFGSYFVTFLNFPSAAVRPSVCHVSGRGPLFL